jgi:hypothetical protein
MLPCADGIEEHVAAGHAAPSHGVSHSAGRVLVLLRRLELERRHGLVSRV